MRDCFIPPIEEFELAATFLDEAVSATLLGDHQSAKELIKKADIPLICEFTNRVIGPIDPTIHWQTSMPKDVLPKHERVESRMPSARIGLLIHERDGWRCRFCGIRVVSKKARAILAKMFPDETRSLGGSKMKHCALNSLAASLDHILPHARGGNNEELNLVTACTCCQFGRNQWTLQEVGFNDPRDREPIIDSWDGLTRILT